MRYNNCMAKYWYIQFHFQELCKIRSTCVQTSLGSRFIENHWADAKQIFFIIAINAAIKPASL